MVPTEDHCLDAALHLLDTGGPKAASIRRVAALLGVPVTTVYTYFPDQAAVFRALTDRVLADVHGRVPVARRTPWQQRVTALALAGRAQLLAHPALVPLMIAGPLDGPSGTAMAQRLSELLGDAGLIGEDVVRGRRLIGAYTLGAVALELGRSADAAQFSWGLERVLAGLNPAN